MVVRHPPLNVRTWNKKLRRQFVNQRRRAKTGKPKMAATDTNSELLPVDRNSIEEMLKNQSCIEW
jgi:hypothetical protein